MAGKYKMKPMGWGTWYFKIKEFQVAPTSPKRYKWVVTQIAQLNRTYLDPKPFDGSSELPFQQCGDSPSPQHCRGMFRRFCDLNGIQRATYCGIISQTDN